MQKQEMLARVSQMEQYFDWLQDAAAINPASVYQDGFLREIFEKLLDYSENGQWLADYTADEQGELPPDLKRGILSQDGLYNLLCEIEQYRE